MDVSSGCRLASGACAPVCDEAIAPAHGSEWAALPAAALDQVQRVGADLRRRTAWLVSKRAHPASAYV